MRKLLDLLLLAAVLTAAWYQYLSHKAELRAVFAALKTRIAPCHSPVRYYTGGIDPRFALSREELLAALREAEAAWERAAGRNLFEYAPQGGDVPVSLVYDNRQYALDKLKAMGMKTDRSLAAYESLKAGYDSLGVQVGAEQARLKAAVTRYKARETAHNGLVAVWNGRGSIPPAERRRLETEKRALSAEFAEVKTAEAAVNANIDVLNAMATMINQLIVQLNLNAAQYDREGSTLGRYEEGLYRVSGGRQSIELYAYTGREQLAGLLAHEMGHALGLDHIADKTAVMHLVNGGNGLEITAADLAELNKACTPSWRRGRADRTPGGR